LGIIAYYAGAFLAGIFIGVFYLVILEDDLSSTNELFLEFLGMPFGLLACWGLYKLLESSWAKSAKASDADVLDSELIQ
jgi:hypothetical protein